jgi:putative heme-binding domain-containing protein
MRRGTAIFEKKCAACHKLGAVGSDVGPNLAALTDRAPRSLLAAILDPSRAVEARYVSYLAVTTDGRSLTGILETETGNSITLLGEQAKRQTILRADLELLRSSGKSLMPDGLERDLSPQDLADLIAVVARAGLP